MGDVRLRGLSALFIIAVLGCGSVPASAQPDKLSTTIKRANALFAAGKHADAITVAEQALALVEERVGRNHVDYASIQKFLGSAHSKRFIALFKAGKIKEAERDARQALAYRTSAFGDSHPRVGQSLNHLSLAQRVLGRHARAEDLASRALEIYEKSPGGNGTLVAGQLSNLGDINQTLGRLPIAEDYYKRSLAIRQRTLGNAHPQVADSLRNLAGLQMARGQYERAEQLYRSALAIFQNRLGNNHSRVAGTLTNLALLYTRQSIFEDAERLYRRAIAVSEKAHGKRHPQLASALNNLAALYEKRHRYGEAEKLHERALAMRRQIFGRHHPEVAQSLHNLARVYQKLGEHAQAEQLFKKVLAYRQKIFGDRHPEVAASLRNLASLYVDQGRHTDARPLGTRALEITEAAYGGHHPLVAHALFNLGLTDQRQGRDESAFQNFKRAATIIRTRYREEAAARAKRGKIKTGSGQIFRSLALAAWRLALQEPDRFDGLTATAYMAAQSASQTSTEAALGQMAARIGAGSTGLAKLVRRRQDLLRQLLALDKQLIRVLADQKDKRDQLAVDDLGKAITTIRAEIAGLESRLAKLYPGFAELANPKPLNLEDTRKLLGADEALVFYHVNELNSFVWAVTRDRVFWEGIAQGRDDLAADIAALRKSLDPVAALSSGGRGFTREQVCRGFERDGGERAACEAYNTDLGRAHKLYKTLLRPVEPSIAGKKHLIVVPSGPLTGLPFHMLVSKSPPASGSPDERFKAAEWLIRRHAVTVLPSVTSLRALRVIAQKGQAERPFIGIGDPSFVKPRQKQQKARGQKTLSFASYFRGRLADVDLLSGAIPPLPDTAEELKAVGNLLGVHKRDIILGRRASETTLKSLSAEGRLDDYQVVHFATHGLVAGEIEGLAEPALALSLPSKATERDDGLLTASEVAQLKLNADWVVLSACNTAAGDKPGAEALSGLARAFFYSGTRALLVSHWPVVSEAAVKLTIKTFSSLKADPTMGRAEALRRSMLMLIDDGKPYQRHPSYWAPFIIVGEGGRPVS